MQDKPFSLLVWNAVAGSRRLATAGLLLTFGPILVALLSWLLGSPGWLVFLIMVPSPFILGAGVYLPARAVWKKEARKVAELEKRLQAGAAIQLRSSTDGQWAYLEVENVGKEDAEVEVKMKSILGLEPPTDIIPYHVSWRDQADRARKIKAGNSAFLNVAQVSTADLMATPSEEGLELALSDKVNLRFYSADMREGDSFSGSARRDSGIRFDIEVYATPPLATPCSPSYRLYIDTHKRFSAFERIGDE